MRLKNLIKDCSADAGELEITSLVVKSSTAKKGSMFFALKGVKNDGSEYVEEAVKNGAVCIISEKECDGFGAIVIKVDDDRRALAEISARFYNNPQIGMKFVGITGTNGKTTTSYMIRSILHEAGKKTGLIGTLGAFIDDKPLECTDMTTPDPPKLFEILFKMKKAGVTHVIMEVSAHALALKKTFGIVFDVAALTNAGRDHLDYFETEENYKEAKKLLFLPEKCLCRVLNADDSFGQLLYAEFPSGTRTYGVNNPADAFAIDEECSLGGIRFVMNLCDDILKIACPTAGRFNVYNALCAALTCKQLGVNARAVAKGLKNVGEVDGRFNVIGGARQKIVIDFAHTPESLKNAICSLKECSSGKIVAVFGCGGDRDRGKRPQMGKVACENADFCVVTSDNPRSEDPKKIIEDVVSGIKTSNYEVVPDRKQAIRYALECAGDNGVVLIAGKGGEKYQEINGVKYEFSDAEFVRGLIDEKVIE